MGHFPYTKNIGVPLKTIRDVIRSTKKLAAWIDVEVFSPRVATTHASSLEVLVAFEGVTTCDAKGLGLSIWLGASHPYVHP